MMDILGYVACVFFAALLVYTLGCIGKKTYIKAGEHQ